MHASAVRRAALATLAAAAPRVRGDVTVVLTDDATVRRLNRTYRGQDRSTDVLSFPLGEGTSAGEPFGDVIISVETARKQAHEYGANLELELLRLLVHGTLHLCGHDHHRRRQARVMQRLTHRLLKALRLGA